MDVLARLERWAKVKSGEMPTFTDPTTGDTLHEAVVAAVAEIKDLRATTKLMASISGFKEIVPNG